MSKISPLWVKRYAPLIIDDIIFKNEELRKIFKKMIKDGSVPNLIFAGVQGSGKSTLSNALVHELGIDPVDHLRINASSDSGIDVIRNRIIGFSQTMPLGNLKVVQLEEFRLSHAAQECIRAPIEDSSDTCRFIITTNYANKILPSVKSRFQEYEFTAPDLDQVMIYAAEILDKEGVNIDDPELFEKIVRSVYPDIRKVVQLLQQYSHDGVLLRPEGYGNNDDYKLKLLDYIEKSDYVAARKTICEQIQPEDYDDLYQFLYQNIHRCPKFKDPKKEEDAICMISDHLYKHAFFAHPHINLASLFINLGNL